MKLALKILGTLGLIILIGYIVFSCQGAVGA